MKIPAVLLPIVILFGGFIFLAGCTHIPDGEVKLRDREPEIYPDYSGVTIPWNIAPLNFTINEGGRSYKALVSSPSGKGFSVTSSGHLLKFPQKAWKKLLLESKGAAISIKVFTRDSTRAWTSFTPIRIYVADADIDPYLCYRLLYPGYETWSSIKIIQRDIENFNESSLVENQVLDHNCVNCHSFNHNDPEQYLLHVRGSMGGTYFVDRGKVTKTDLKTADMKAGAVYPAWHPSGKFVAFSSNNVIQSFHAISDRNIEVLDLASSLYLYDLDRNMMLPVADSSADGAMETFPEWSPDGKYLYFCRAKPFIKGSDFRTIKYELARKSFDASTGNFGETEKVFDAPALGKSVSFPRISPDGHYLAFTLHDYGTFSIWHKEADLYMMDLENGETAELGVNSNETESYHSWSTNGRWLVFSSKRGDGLTARPYIAYIGEDGRAGKPFLLPRKDPDDYATIAETFNKPEFVTGRISQGPRDFAKAAKTTAVKAGSAPE